MNTIKPKIFLFASEIAAFIGQNKWDYVTPFERVWKKCDKLTYQGLINKNLDQINKIKNDIDTLENSKKLLLQDLEDKTITKRQYTLRLNKIDKNIYEKKEEVDVIETKVDDIDLSQKEKLEKYLGTDIIEHIGDSNIETNNKRIKVNQIIESLDIKDDKRLDNIKQHAESYINKTHGTLKEDDAIAIYEKKYGVKLDVSQQFNKKYLKDISQNSQYDWYICGKVDGLYIDSNDNSKNYIVEVKNRTKGFFNNLRDYEKTQIQLYIWMLDMPISKLVEKHESKIRVTQVYKDGAWINDILEYLEIFITAFEYKFLKDEELKCTYLMSDKESKQQILKRLYLNPINTRIIEKLSKDDDIFSKECDIE